MRKKWNRALSFLAAAGMILSVPGGTGSVQAGGAAPAIGTVQGGETRDGAEEEGRQQKEYKEGEAIIMYRSNQITAKRFQEGKPVLSDVEIVDTYDFDAPKGIHAKGAQGQGFKVSLVRSDRYSTDELIRKLKEDSSIQYAEPNYKIHVMDTDPYLDYQWALENKGQNCGTEGLDTKASELEEPDTEDEMVIALVDTGIDYEHEDLQDKVWNNPKRSRSFKGYHGYDFINADEDPMDDNGHGSHCSGIMAAAADNGKGISGIDTDDNVKIMGLKILDAEGSGYGYEAMGAYNYIYKAQCEGVNVVAVNNSWGGGDDEDGIFAELVRLVGENGAVSVCAAGNEDSDNDSVYTFPACIDSPYILSVAASNEKDELAAFSNYGKESVEIAAPGTDILSTVCKECFNPTIYGDKDELCQKYESFEGAGLSQVMDESGYLEESEIIDVEEGLQKVEYGLNSDGGTGDVKVEVVNGENFGLKDQDGASLKWTIKGAKGADQYLLYFPYETEASKTALYSSVMVKVQGPKGEGDDFFGFGYSTIIAADAAVDEKGKINIESAVTLGGSYVNDGNYWTHLSGKTLPAVKKTKKRALVLSLSAGEGADGDFTVYVDDIGVSKPDVEASAFGKYDFYNGTSMATPYATGAVAAVAARYPEEDALQRKARITGSVRKAEALADKTITGGVLDLTKIDRPGMMVQEISSDGSSVFINGQFLDGARVKVNGKRVNPASSDEYSITIDAADYANEEIEITLERKGDTITRKYFVAAGDAYTREGSGVLTIDGGGVASDGHSIYYIDGSGNVSSVKMEEAFEASVQPVEEEFGGQDSDGKEAASRRIRKAEGEEPAPVDETEVPLDETEVPTGELPEETTGAEPEDIACAEKMAAFESLTGGYSLDLFGQEFTYAMDYSITAATDFVCADGGIYVVLDIDTGYSEKSILAFNDLSGWSCVADIPEDISQYAGYALAVYNGEYYLIGGMNPDTGKCLSPVYRCRMPEVTEETEPEETETDTAEAEESQAEQPEWKMVARLPEGRCFAKAIQVGDKLVITLGGNGTEDVPDNLIYDGRKFTVSKAKLGKAFNSETYTWTDSADKENPEKKGIWYNAMIGQVKDGLIYAGLNVGKLGDTFLYSVEKDAFEAAGYSLKQTGMTGDTTFAVAAEEKLYVIDGNAYVMDDDIWFFRNRIFSGKRDMDEEEEYYFEDEEIDPSLLVDIYSIPVERATMKVVDESAEGGIVAGAGYYMPGAAITLMPEAEEGYQVTEFTVDGVKVEDEVWTGTAGEAGTELRAAVQVEKLPEEEQPVTEEAKQDGAVTTEAPTPGASGTEEAKAAASDNKATTEKPKAQPATQEKATTEKPEEQATTQAAATTEQPSVSVKPLKKGEVVKKGGLKYKVTSDSAVTCTGVTRKTAKSLTVPDKITVDGVEYKVTAIGSKAFKNCKKLTKVTFGKNLNKVGKNLFAGCKKLKKITFHMTGSKANKAIKKQVKNNKKITIENLEK